jgi:hypothetical protein
MKSIKILFVICMVSLWSTISIAQQSNTGLELTTLRIGVFKVFMDKAEAEKILSKTLKSAKESNNYDGNNTITYNGDIITLEVLPRYISDKSPDKDQIVSIATVSKKYRTKSGMGVGSTRYELLESYKDFPSFEMYPEWMEDGKASTNVSYFVLNDNTAATCLVFKMVKNIVVEIRVAINEGGC